MVCFKLYIMFSLKMEKGITFFRFLTCVVLYLQLKPSVSDEENRVMVKCSGGIANCPTVGGKKGDYLGEVMCAFCGTFEKNTEAGAFCKFQYILFKEQFDENKLPFCTVVKNFCDGRCNEGKVKRCETLYLNTYCCVCEDNFGGRTCELPSIVSFHVWSTALEPIKVKLDLRSRSNCWTQYFHSVVPFSQGADKRVSRIAFCQTEPPANTPLWIKLKTGLYHHHFTKFNSKVKKSEAVRWCLTHTDLREYCERFKTFFLPEFNNGVQVKERQLLHSRAEIYFVLDNQVGVQEEDVGSIVWVESKEVGYYQFLGIEVFPYLPEPPLYRNDEFVMLEEKKDLRLFLHHKRGTFVNYTSADLRCFPRILNMCNLKYENMIVYPYMALTFKMEYTKPPKGCKETGIARWEIFQMKSNVDYEGGDEYLSRFGCCVIHFPPYYFPVGKYHVRYTMMHERDGQKFYTSKGCVQAVYHEKIDAEFSELTRVVNTEDLNTVVVEAWNVNVVLPDQRKHLFYRWSCWMNDKGEQCHELKKFLKNVRHFNIPPWTLKVKSTYHFKVEVSSTVRLYGRNPRDPFYSTRGVAYHNVIVTSNELYLITLRCVTCDDSMQVNPQEFNFIVVRDKDGVSPPFPNDYIWAFAEEIKGENKSVTLGEFKPVEDIQDNDGIANILLKIKKNVLKFDGVFVFQVSVPNNKNIFAQIRIKTAVLEPIMSEGLNCILRPTEGVRGWTDFNVVCNFTSSTQIHFEYFDKDANDDRVFGGRMLGYNTVGSLHNFKMTKGKFVILFFDQHAVKSNFTININLTPYNDTVVYLENLLMSDQDSSESFQSESPPATVSAVAEVIEQAMGPPDEVIKQLIFILDRFDTSFVLGLLKMLLSSLKIAVLNTAGKFTLLELDALLTSTAARKLLYTSLKILNHEGSIVEEPTLSVSVVYDMVKTVMDIAEIIFEQKNRQYRAKPEYYVIPAITDLVKSASVAVVDALEISSYTLNRQQIPGDKVQHMYSEEGKIITTTKVDFAQPLSNWSMMTDDSLVVLFNRSIHEGEDRSKLYGIQYIRMLTNPFWWAGDDLVSEVVIVNICQKTDTSDCLKLTRFKTRIEIILNVTEPLNVLPIGGDAYQVNPETSDENKELELTVHRFFLPERARLVLKFFINDTEEYRVKLIEGLRPEYDAMIQNSVLISANSTDYEIPYDDKHPNEKIYYMGILPSTKVSVGERVPFRLKAYYTLCNSWVKWQWTSSGCWVGDKSSEKTIHCACDHLSVIGGGISTPENSLSTVSEFLLYLTPWENLLPLLIALLIVLIYLMLLIWAAMKDKKNKRGGEVIVLKDNFPNEPFAYLIGVHTGSRLFSGTSAAVGIRLLGEVDDSRPHILRSPDRKVLTSFSEDWFMIYNRVYLGKIYRLWLWHNDEGCSPDWFVERVQVYDMQTNVQYVFEINSWIAMGVNSYPDFLAIPMKQSEDVRATTIFRNKFVDGIRDTHKWTSVCLKHPRNAVSRAERVSVLVCFILLAMATCVLLYSYHFGFIDEDKPSYYLDLTDLFIFIVTLLISYIVALLIIVMFRKSFTTTYNVIKTKKRKSQSKKSFEEDEPNTDLRNSIVSTYEPNTDRQNSIVSTYAPNTDRQNSIVSTQSLSEFREAQRQVRPRRGRLSMAVQKIARSNDLQPVQLTGTKSDQIVRKPCLIAAWILCVCTIFISLLIILFYAWKLPIVKNYKVLTILLAVVVFDAFVISFLRIFIFAAVMTCLGNVAELETTCNIDIEDGKRSHLFGNRQFLTELYKKRKQRIYYPLSEAEREIKRKKKVIMYRWRVLMEFIMIGIFVCFIFAFCTISYVDRYASNSHATRMMTSGPSKSFPTLQQVFNKTDLFVFLEVTYINEVFKYMWYNYEPLIGPESNRKDWTFDGVSRLLGNIRIRQLRVSMNSCRVSGYFNESIEFCAASWSTGAEDREEYATSWRLPDQEDFERKISTWRFTKPGDSNSSWFYGQSGTMYHRGGYIADLGYFRKRTRGTLLTLEKEDWLDHMTRAVFVEMSYYNLNTDLFTEVVLVCEQHPTGQYISIPKVESVSISADFDIWKVGIIIFLVIFLCRILYVMNRYGVFVYLSSAINIYGTFCLVLGFLTIALYVLHVKYSSLYVENFYRTGLDGFFSFNEIFHYEFMSKLVLCLLLIFVVIRLLFSWRFGRIFFTFFYTVSLSLSWIIWLTINFMICLTIIWRFIGYNINVYIFSYYSSTIMYSKDFKVTGVHERWLEHLFVYLMCILTSFVLLIFITSFVHFYGVAKYFKPLAYSEIDDFSYIKFFKMEYKRVIRKEEQQD